MSKRPWWSIFDAMTVCYERLCHRLHYDDRIFRSNMAARRKKLAAAITAEIETEVERRRFNPEPLERGLASIRAEIDTLTAYITKLKGTSDD